MNKTHFKKSQFFFYMSSKCTVLWCVKLRVSLCLPGAYNLVEREIKQIYNIREMPRMKKP